MGGDSTAITMGQGGQQGSRRSQQRPRVWIEDENGKLKMVFIQTGVTDNSITEVKSGDLEEGQQVLTGQTVTSGSSSFGRPPGGMMFMRR